MVIAAKYFVFKPGCSGNTFAKSPGDLGVKDCNEKRDYINLRITVLAFLII